MTQSTGSPAGAAAGTGAPAAGAGVQGSPHEPQLRRSRLFSGLSPEQVDWLVPRLVLREVPKGGLVFRQGDQGDELYVVLEGRVALEAAGDTDHGLLAVLDPGDVFGELSLFDPGPRTSTATALEDTALGVAPRADVLAWTSAHPAVGHRLLQVLARRLRRTNSAMRDLVFVDVPGRLAQVLLELTARYGSPTGQGHLVVDHGLTQQQLAGLVGSSREGVNKALSDFSNRGWVSVQPRRIVVLDQPSLRRRARGSAAAAVPLPD